MRRANTTSQQLKDSIARTLLELMAQKPYRSISVQELTAAAGLSRATFYRYFSGMEAALEYAFEQECSCWFMKKIPQEATLSVELATLFFRFFLENRELCQLIANAGQSEIIIRFFERHFNSSPIFTNFGEYDRAFLVGGLFGILHQWIRADMAESPHQLAEALLRQVTKLPPAINVWSPQPPQ